MELLRFATAGSVDDGKSTLVGRLLYETKSVLADQLDAVERASVDRGLSTPDLSLLTDGLRAERSQGITIDVAYRYFGTPKRNFILADTPGHVQYTRNTVTGASTSQLAVILVDASFGVVEQTCRHTALLALLRVPRLVLAVNKMDLAGYDETVFDAIAAAFTELSGTFGYPAGDVDAIPVSALEGDNVVVPSPRMPWYDGPTLLDVLESVPVTGPEVAQPLRMPVQYVIRPRTGVHADYRGYAGRISAGTVRDGDEVVVLPSGQRSSVRRIDTPRGRVGAAEAGRSATVVLEDDVDVARGDLIVGAAGPAAPTLRSEFDATLCWLSEKPLDPGAKLLIRHGTRTTQCIVTALHGCVDIRTATTAPAQRLAINDIGRVGLRTADQLPLEPYALSRATGRFLLIDPVSGNTLAAGLID
jgi:sulfate adenylyltransferase subunit 1